MSESSVEDLYRLANDLEHLDEVVAEVAVEVAPDFEQQIKNIGKPGKALRAGNAVAAHVEAQGTSVHVKGVFVKPSKQRGWARSIGRALNRAVTKRLRDGGI